MAARGQQNFGLVPDVVSSGGASYSQGLTMDVAVSHPCLEQHHNLRPLRQRFGDFPSRDSGLTHENSPRFICQNVVQAAQQPYAGGTSVDPSGFCHYEDFAGILGERLASGSLSDVSASASEKVCSGYSSSGEHHGPRVKLMCSFGGRILPRPGDGKLRYVGGDTRIISVYRHTKYGDLMHKMGRLYEQPVVLKYQLPNEDLDALISISCDEDVENMMDEYDRLQASEGSSRLRIFLFSSADYDYVHTTSPVDIRNTDQLYMDTINGMPETRPISVVPLSCSGVLTGQVPDTLGATQIPSNVAYVLPVVSNTQLAPSLVQPVLFQSSKPVMSRVLSASPSTPPSPTVASQVPAIRQPGITDAHLYGDQFFKGHVAHVHDLPQRVDAVYQDVEGLGSRTSSLNSQHDGHYRHFEAMRLMDSPKKSQQNEGMVDHPHFQEQMLVADSVLPRTAQTSVLPRVDSHGRIPKVGSNKSLLGLQQQQQAEILGSLMSDKKVESHLTDPLQRPLDVQNPIFQDQAYHPQAAWHYNRETRREDSSRLETVRLAVPDDMQYLSVLPQQLHAPYMVSPVVITSHEMAGYNQQNQPSGAVNSILLQKPVTMQTNFHAHNILHPGIGQVSASPLHPGSAPSSPRVKFQDMNLNSTGIHPVLIGRGGFTGGFVEQPSSQLIAQPPIEPVFRGLKPLNIRRDPREQVLLGDEQAGMQQPSSPLLKHQEIRGAFRQQEGDGTHSFYSDGLAGTRTTPYRGGSPYREHLTPFADNRLPSRDEQGQEQVSFESGFAAKTNVQEGIDWSMKRPENETANMRWIGLGQVDVRGEASSYVTNTSASGASSVFNTSDISFVNPLSNDAAKFDSNVFSRTSFTPPAVTCSPIFDRGRISSSSTQVSPSNAALYTEPDMLGTVREDLVPKATPQPAFRLSPKSANPNSFFVTDLEDGQWIKGVQDVVQTSEDSPRLENRLQINDSLYLGGELSRQTSDKDMCSQDERNELPVVEGGNFKGSRSKSNDALNANARWQSNEGFNVNMQLPPHGNHNAVEVSNSLLGSLSPRVSAGNLGLGSSPPSVTLEPLSHSNCLAEEASSLSSSHLSGAVETNVDLPIFDSGPVENDEVRFIRSSKASANVDIELLPPTLYTAPTLSMQNWEENLSAAQLEEFVQEKSVLDKNMPDNVEMLVAKRETLEVNVDVVSDDVEGANGNLAASAEAEAVSRGLQTIKNSDLEELRELGTGTFGTVYHGKWRGTDVAIKRIKSSCFSGRPSERDRLIADFWKEAYILGQLHHPNVVAFYGVVPDGPGGTLATVTEYMVNGSLKQVLQKKDRTIDRRKRLFIIMDAAFGMEYLHGKNIVHFDLKCENLLVNMKDPQRPICKVGDLGLSKVKHQTMVSGGVRGTLPWMAPELLNGSSSLVSEKVDVFSFGIVMWELLTGEEPYANMHYGAIIGGIVNNTLRPPVPSWCDPAWKSLMEKCWSADPSERPSFLEISAELRTMANARTPGQASGAGSGDSIK